MRGRGTGRCKALGASQDGCLGQAEWGIHSRSPPQPQPTPRVPCTPHFAGKFPQQRWDLRKGRELHEGSSESTARPQQLSTRGQINGAGLSTHLTTFWPQDPPWEVHVLAQLGWGSWPGVCIMSPWGPPGILLDEKSATMPQFHDWSLCQSWTSLKCFLGTSNYGHSEMNISQHMTFAPQGQHTALQHGKINEPCV